MATRSKEKAAARKANADKRPQAHAKYIRISPPSVPRPMPSTFASLLGR